MHGRLGHGDEEDQHTPKLITALQGVRVCAVSAGSFQSLALSLDGSVYSWGSGWLVLRAVITDRCPRAPTFLATMGRALGNKVFWWKRRKRIPTILPYRALS